MRSGRTIGRTGGVVAACAALLAAIAGPLPAAALAPAAPGLTPPDLPLPIVITPPAPPAPAPPGIPGAPAAVPLPVALGSGAPVLPAQPGQPGAAPDAGPAPAGPPPYTPPPEEAQALPAEPERLAYEQQQSDVAYDAARLDEELAGIAAAAGGGSGRFGWPVVSRGRIPITQRFGCTDLAGEPFKADCASHRWHTGIDLAVPLGTPVFAADAGVVRTVRSERGYGNYALVTHGNGYATLYGHLSGFAVRDGAVVDRGEPIGYAGSSGFSTGPHLHFEVRLRSTFVDPCAELGC